MKNYIFVLILFFGCVKPNNKSKWSSNDLDFLQSRLNEKNIFNGRTILEVFDDYALNFCMGMYQKNLNIKKSTGFDFNKFRAVDGFNNYIFKYFNIHSDINNNIKRIDAVGDPSLSICVHNSKDYKYFYYLKSSDEESLYENAYTLHHKNHFLGFDRVNEVWFFITKTKSQTGFLKNIQDIKHIMILDKNLYPLVRISFEDKLLYRITKMMYKDYKLMYEISYEVKNKICLNEKNKFEDIIKIIKNKGNVIGFLQPTILEDVRNVPSWLCQLGDYDYYEE